MAARPAAALALCAGLALLLYAPAIGAYFVSEDLRFVTLAPPDVMDEWLGRGSSMGYRPASALYWSVMNALWGRSPEAHRGVALLIHALSGWMVYLVSLRVLGAAQPAAAAALLFVAAPVNAESVMWLSAASGTLTSGFACLVAVWAWVRRDPSRGTRAIVSLLYLAALLFKEAALPLPLLLFFADRAAFGRPPRERLRLFLPLLVPLAGYAALYLGSGSLGDSARYGLRGGAGQIAAVWCGYARDLWQPFSNLMVWGLGFSRDNPVWLALSALLFLRPGSRLLGLWTVAALLPGAFAHAERNAYLAVVPVGMAFVQLGRSVASFALGKHDKARVACGAALGLTLLAEGVLVHRDTRNWLEAGRLAHDIPRQALALAPMPPAGAQMLFLDLPDNVGGAYALRWGLPQEIRHVYGRSDLRVAQVTRRPAPARLALDTLPCEASEPRLFFVYRKGALRQASPREFGLACPEP